MKFVVLTLFPEMFELVKTSIIKRAIENDLIELEVINIRDFSKNSYNQVDDTPYGGGAGMVLKPDVVADSIKFAKTKVSEDARVIYMSPKGKTLNQAKVVELSKLNDMIILCGHYEGIDQRVIDKYVDEEISIGDYVLTGGEIPAMTIIDSVSRYIDGVLSEDSTKEESFANNLLEYPQYTKPFEFEGTNVPEVLTSGDHKKVDEWRKEQSLIITYEKRRDLLNEEQIEEAKKLIENK